MMDDHFKIMNKNRKVNFIVDMVTPKDKWVTCQLLNIVNVLRS